MTPTEMEQQFEMIDRRLAGIEQILPTLATKADLERYATKADLERFATKADLERFATKADLERFATKADLAEGLAQQRAFTESVRDEVRTVAEGLAALTVTVSAIHHTLDTLVTRLEANGVI